MFFALVTSEPQPQVAWNRHIISTLINGKWCKPKYSSTFQCNYQKCKSALDPLRYVCISQLPTNISIFNAIIIHKPSPTNGPHPRTSTDRPIERADPITLICMQIKMLRTFVVGERRARRTNWWIPLCPYRTPAGDRYPSRLGSR